MESLKQPKPMVMEGDLGINWKKFKNSFTVFLTATGGTAKKAEVQVAILLHCIGEQAYEVYETMELTDEERKSYTELLNKFDEYFLPKSNVSVETHKFNTRTQGQVETFDNSLNELRRLASNCDFGDFKDRLITDRIVSGIRDQRVKDRLLRETHLTLTKAIDICRAAEQTETHIRQLADGTRTLEVGEIKRDTKYKLKNKQMPSKEFQRNSDSKWRKEKGTRQGDREANTNRNGEQGPSSSYVSTRQRSRCSRCGLNHLYRQCPAFGKICNKCSKYNHFAACCKNKSVQAVENVDASHASENNNDYVLGSLNVSTIKNDWFETMKILNCNKSQI